MGAQCILDHPGIDTVAAALDKFFGAAGHPDEFIEVNAPEIAGIKPIAFEERLLGGFTAKVAAEDHSTTHGQDADLIDIAIACGLSGGVGADRFDLAVGKPEPDRALPASDAAMVPGPLGSNDAMTSFAWMPQVVRSCAMACTAPSSCCRLKISVFVAAIPSGT